MLNLTLTLNFVMLLKSHLESYPCPAEINFFWNFGFLLGISIIIQLVTGLLLSSHYSSDISTAYMSVQLIMREVYYGWALRYIHANGASFVFFFVFAHMARSIFYQSYAVSPNTWLSGVLMLIMLMATAFMGYVLPFGQMSFWGATVILNLLSCFPCMVEWLCGGYTVGSPTLQRFFVFHFVLPFIICGFAVLHIFYLHSNGSNNPLGIQTNNKIPFFPYVVIKDFFGLLIVLSFYILQCFFGVWTFCHPDNNIEANSLETPLHIVPEWYFLSQYAMLKAIPNKNAGFLILLSSILVLVFFAEVSSMSTMIHVGHSSIMHTLFFLCVVCLIKIGAQFPQEKFISYARVLTFDYYMIIIYILLLQFVLPVSIVV
jgi:quinol-cytochrome oxidoreductase complex cytochrome b subunit